MRGARYLLMAAVVLGAAATILLLISLPNPPVSIASTRSPTTLVGAYHVHSLRSDGTGSVDAIAEAASAAGLDFVIVTDHGSATRVPDPPAYRHGVLCLDAVEISTDDGHVVALGLPGAAPYPLAGTGEDVVEDVHRLGGLAVAAHPNSPRAALRWRSNAPVDGVEWLNVDSEWRDETNARLALASLQVLIRAPGTVASLFDAARSRWRRFDRPAAGSAPAALTASDAHARMVGWTEGDAPGWTPLNRPSYREMFETVSQAVTVETPLTGDPGRDAAMLLDAIRRGRTYGIVRAIAWPAELVLEVRQGSAIPASALLEPGIETSLAAWAPGARDAGLTLVRNGQPLADAVGRLEWQGVPAPGDVLRLHVTLPSHPFPWIVASPLYARGVAETTTGSSTIADGPVQPLGIDGPWSIERDPGSVGEIGIEGLSLRLSYTLAEAQALSPYVALVSPVDSGEGFDRISFVGRAERPMRLSVQVRLPGPREGQRWGRSVYLDETARLVVLPMNDLSPIGATTTVQPIVSQVRSLLFVIDTVNSPAGSGGSVWLSDIGLGVGQVDRN